MEGKENQRKADDGKGFSAPSVGVTVRSPVGSDCIGEVVPQEEADDHGKENEDGGYYKDGSVILQHGWCLLSIR